MATTLKTWRVLDIHGNPESITAHHMFNNEDGSLTFRWKDETRSDVVAAFGRGGWTSAILLKDEKPEPAPTTTTPRNNRQSRHEYDDEIPF